MNKSILKTCLPKTTKTLPVYLNDDASAWWYSSGSLMVNLRAVITDYPHMMSDLSDIAPISGTSLVPNYGFSAGSTSGSIPQYWGDGGRWYDSGISGSSITPTFPLGFSWNRGIGWDTALSYSPLSPASSLSNEAFVYIVSGSFTVISGSEYSTSIRFISNNGSWNINSNTVLPDKETSYSIKIQNVETIVNVEEDNYQYLPINNSKYTLEADYGAIVVCNISGSTFTELIASGRGRTTYEINPYDTDTYIPYAAPVWKNYKSSFVPQGATGTTGTARVYIYNRYVKRPNSPATGWLRPSVQADLVVVTPSKPYITSTISSSSVPLNMDSYSYFEADSPIVTAEINNLELYATSLTSTGCSLTVTSGSVTTTTTGFHTPGVEVSNNSHVLQFGKDDGETIWSSWIPFSASPALTGLTEGVRITSASLTFVATEDIASTPSKTCYITTGLESTGYNETPTPPTNYSQIAGKTIAKQLNTALLDSWVTGEEYSIDITDSVKEQLGKKAISWWNGGIAALVKNNNSAIGGYRQIASGSHIAYSSPKLTIGYVKNGYPKKSLVTTIRADNPLKNYYNYTTMDIGGNTSASTVSRSLAYFNLDSLPSGSITSASLYLYQTPTTTITGSQTLRVYPVSGSRKWDYYGTTWIKRFGAGATSNWTTQGGDYYSGSMVGELSGITNVSSGLWRIIPFSTGTGLIVLNNMKTGVLPNNGFLIKDSGESTDSMGKYLSSNYQSNNAARPKLVVEINNVTYTIQYSGASEDVGGGSTPPPAPISGTIEMVKQQWSETGGGGNKVDYSLAGGVNTNRYLLVSEGWSDNNRSYGYDAKFTTLFINGSEMTKVLTITSDESNLIMWGIKIPNTWASGVNMVITGNKVNGVGGGRTSIPLHVREFMHVNQTTPIYKTVSLHNGANSAVECKEGGLAIEYVAKGWVADAVFLANESTALGVPQLGFTHQVRDNSLLRYGFSHFTPTTTAGTVAFNWKWNRDGNAEFMSSGSDNALGIVSLNPD